MFFLLCLCVEMADNQVRVDVRVLRSTRNDRNERKW